MSALSAAAAATTAAVQATVLSTPGVFKEDLETDTDTSEQKITPVSMVDVDPVFEKRTRDMQSAAAEAEAGYRQGEQVQWMRPEDWDGDVFDYDSPTPSFDTKVCEEAFIQAHSSAKQPGTTGDIITAITQVDYVDTMERAFRARQLYPLSRCMALLAGRKKGHGSKNGVFGGVARNYVRRLSKQAKKKE